MHSEALDGLLTRHSIGPKHLVEPGPSDEQLALMVEVALRAPDFKVVKGEARQQLAQLFAEAARRAGKDEAGVQMDFERALQPPVSVAVVARLDHGHPQVPVHEQWACVGGALANFLNAAHLLGYGGKMLSGAKVRDAAVQAAFCAPGEQLLGWISLGTPARQSSKTARKPGVEVALQTWTAP
jgi:hypothetical protein